MLRLSSEGTSLVVISGGQLRTAALPGDGRLEAPLAIRAALPGALDAVYLRAEPAGSGELWVVSDAARPLLSRWRIGPDAAERLGVAELALGGERLIGVPGFPPGAIW